MKNIVIFLKKKSKKKNQTYKIFTLVDLLGVGLGFGSTLLGKKAAMLCTASVEEVIDDIIKTKLIN